MKNKNTKALEFFAQMEAPKQIERVNKAFEQGAIKLNSIQPTLHALKLGLKELYGDRLVKLILFGSHARGEANSDSDIDLLAVLKSPVSQVQEISYMSELCVKILLDYDELVSIVPMSEDRFNAKDVALLRNIQREGIEL